MTRLRSSLFFLFVGLLFTSAVPAAGQSVSSIVDDMQARYQQQLDAVDTYIVETNLYTSYNKKVMKDGAPTYQTQTRMKGEGASSYATTSTPSAAYGLQFDRLKEHATYTGTETINGVRTHLLQVDDPSKINPDMSQGDAGRMIYYIDAEQHVPTRMVMKPQNKGKQGPEAASVTINMTNYQTTDGLTLPHRMEIQVEMNMSEQERKQMEQAIAQMKNMPEQQRKQMERMMGDKMEMMKQMMSGEPIIVEVQSVKVNVDLPDEFSSTVVATYSGSGRMNTDPFSVSGSWKVKWKSDAKVFSLYAVKDKDSGSPSLLAGSNESSTGSSYVREGGKYYFKVISDGDWTIEVIKYSR